MLRPLAPQVHVLERSTKERLDQNLQTSASPRTLSSLTLTRSRRHVAMSRQMCSIPWIPFTRDMESLRYKEGPWSRRFYTAPNISILQLLLPHRSSDHRFCFITSPQLCNIASKEEPHQCLDPNNAPLEDLFSGACCPRCPGCRQSYRSQGGQSDGHTLHAHCKQVQPSCRQWQSASELHLQTSNRRDGLHK